MHDCFVILCPCNSYFFVSYMNHHVFSVSFPFTEHPSQVIYTSPIPSFTIRFQESLVAVATLVLIPFARAAAAPVTGNECRWVLTQDSANRCVEDLCTLGKGWLQNSPVLELPSMRLQRFIRRTLLVLLNLIHPLNLLVRSQSNTVMH